MLPISRLFKQLDHKKLIDYAGVRFEKTKCLGKDVCSRELTDPTRGHEQHDWYEEVLVCDAIEPQYIPANLKKDYPSTILLPIRWYNFVFVYVKELKEAVKNGVESPNEVEFLAKALERAGRENFTDIHTPKNLPAILVGEEGNYAKFNADNAESIKLFETKVFLPSIQRLKP